MTSLPAVTLDSDSLNRQAMKHPHHHRSLVRCTRLTLDLHFSSCPRIEHLLPETTCITFLAPSVSSLYSTMADTTQAPEVGT